MASMIEVRGLSKQYHLGESARHTANLREIVVGAVKSPFQRRKEKGPQESGSFWALRDVSFDVAAGEIVGIIGANGAGKSTLLKILSRITDPSGGRIVLHGRMASLLEVGTGFHPELSGRENIYMNGAVLGMRHAEIKEKFDEIVQFAEIEKFLDTPVKHYSSGMSVRLGFAVAAHLQPEILIVDEVLAVGDSAFQKKCLGKMSEVSKSGRTVLFVSHNMAAVGNLCERGIVLRHGQIIYDGETKGAIREYLALANRGGEGENYRVDLLDAPGRKAGFARIFQSAELFTTGDQPAPRAVQVGDPLKVKLHLKLPEEVQRLTCAIGINSLFGERILTLNTLCDPDLSYERLSGDVTVTCEVPSLTLAPGEYMVSVFLDFSGRRKDVVHDAFILSVLVADYYGTGRAPFSGAFVAPHFWRVESAAPSLIATAQ